ncbi:tetracenomycin A2 monooxygenase-dioxygenase [Rhizobiales bacterium GAS188]|nr:tetracenomycin A2 monooxygenase-dioxygenase [Rhizobiales bacterium GAS188]
MVAEAPVLIVGGSLNGLSTALFLAHQGVRCIVVERHASTTVQYKFRGISPRSMEIYRSVGIEPDIRARDTGDQVHGIARAKNLSDPNVQWTGLGWPDTTDLSPTPPATCDQDRLEPVLRAHAERLGAEMRFNTELMEFEQDEREVRARIRNRETGAEETVSAAYLVAADGTNGKIRKKLGLSRHGAGTLQHWMSIIFETDLQPVLGGRRFTSCFVTDLNGSIVPRGTEGRWLLGVQYSPERGERPEQFDEAFCRELVRKAAGRPDVEARLVDARPWEVAAYVADRFRRGRVFLVGDAAHVMPPTGGFGGNTGIHDAHNLAWKIAHVLHRGAARELLDTYDSERRPVADATLAQALARLAAWFKDPNKRLPAPVDTVPEASVIFGQLYPAGAFIPDAEASKYVFEDPGHPSGRPGSRAPHVVVEHEGKRLSTLDLFGRGFVLLAGADGEAWIEASLEISLRTGVEIQAYRMGRNLRDVEGLWQAKCGVNASGAVLVRPDGIVAWRSRDGERLPHKVIIAALALR